MLSDRKSTLRNGAHHWRNGTDRFAIGYTSLPFQHLYYVYPYRSLNLAMQSRLAVRLIEEHDENPYYPDAVEKYFARPYAEELDNMCYPDYFRIYDISTTKAKSNYLGKDQLG
jgi:hypothetical protein